MGLSGTFRPILTLDRNGEVTPYGQSSAHQVLLIDDDPSLRDLVAEHLAEHGFTVIEAADGESGLEAARGQSADLVILDLGLPGISGLEVLRQLRETTMLPVILLTGLGHETDRVLGLELGADDYVVKPFSPRELVARVRALLRRTRDSHPESILSFGDLSIDRGGRDVTLEGTPIELTAREYDLLAFLAQSRAQVFSRAQILDAVWTSSPDWLSPKTVDEHIHRLRRKLHDDPLQPRWIETKRGAGYRFVGPPPA